MATISKSLSSSTAPSVYTINGSANNTISTSGGSIGISNSGLYYSTSIFPDPDVSLLDAVARYLTEEEIDDLLSKLMERETTIKKEGTNFREIIRSLVRSRHFTEDFIMKYYDHLEKRDILTLHTPDITTQAYAQLALLLMSDDDKK